MVLHLKQDKMSDTCADWVKAWDDDNIGFHHQEVDQ